MILSDTRILEEREKGRIVITPFHIDCLGSNSYDVHLSENLATYTGEVIDAKKDNPIVRNQISDEGFVLEPGKLYLGSTFEYTETHGLVPFLEGKSSAGRLGISIHETAGKGDAGFKGNWTLEMTVSQRVRIYRNMPIGQIFYHTLEGDVGTTYDQKKGAKYSNQGRLPVESRMHLNFGKDPLWK